MIIRRAKKEAFYRRLSERIYRYGRLNNDHINFGKPDMWRLDFFSDYLDDLPYGVSREEAFHIARRMLYGDTVSNSALIYNSRWNSASIIMTEMRFYEESFYYKIKINSWGIEK